MFMHRMASATAGTLPSSREAELAVGLQVRPSKKNPHSALQVLPLAWRLATEVCDTATKLFASTLTRPCQGFDVIVCMLWRTKPQSTP